MVHSGGIGNDFELHTQFWKQGRYNGAFRRHSKLFGTAEKKTEIKDNKLCMLAAFERNWKCREKRRKKEDAKWCILTVFEKSWNCRDHFDTRTLSRALFWHIMKCHLKLPWEEATHALTSLRGRELGCAPAILDFFKNKVGDWCTRMLFETIIWKSEKIVKIRAVNGAFCRYLIRCFDMQRNFWKQ